MSGSLPIAPGVASTTSTIVTPPIGNKMKNLYDPDVIKTLVAEQSVTISVEQQEKLDPFDNITVKKHTCEEGFVLFSKLFHKPKNIPNIPIRVYKAEDWDEASRNHIPPIDPCWVWNKKALEEFAIAMHCGDTTLLFGLQGTGKSCLAEQWCASLIIPFWRMSCNRETREGHFVGSPAVEYNEAGQIMIKQEPTILTDSLKYGGLFCEDEAFRHNSALVLQSLREKNTRCLFLPDAPGRTADERILSAPKGRWWYVLTDNTTGTGDETGIFDAEVQDASTLDRIGAHIEVKYLSKPQEVSILTKHTELNKEVIKAMVDFGNKVREAFNNQQIMTTFSVRSLLAWAEKIELTGSIEGGLSISWYTKLSDDDKALTGDIFHQIFARTIK